MPESTSNVGATVGRPTLDMAFASAGRRTAQQLGPALKAHARRAGWPFGVVDSLYVAFADGAFVPSYPESVRKQVEDLEYGSETKPAMPALRTWQSDAASFGAAPFDRALMEEVWKTGALI